MTIDQHLNAMAAIVGELIRSKAAAGEQIAAQLLAREYDSHAKAIEAEWKRLAYAAAEGELKDQIHG